MFGNESVARCYSRSLVYKDLLNLENRKETHGKSILSVTKDMDLNYASSLSNNAPNCKCAQNYHTNRPCAILCDALQKSCDVFWEQWLLPLTMGVMQNGKCGCLRGSITRKNVEVQTTQSVGNLTPMDHSVLKGAL